VSRRDPEQRAVSNVVRSDLAVADREITAITLEDRRCLQQVVE
jgi:hypothetical protein